MARFREFVRWESESGDPLTIRGVTVTPQSQALLVRWPNGGLVWNRPVAIQVERGGQIERIPIVDATRTSRWGLRAASIIVLGIALIQEVRMRRNYE